MPPSDNDIAVEIAQLREQVKGVDNNISEIRSTLSSLINLDKTIVELTVYSRQTQESMKTLWERQDELRKWQAEHDTHSSTVKASIQKELETSFGNCQKELLATDKKVDAWINSARGAAWALGIVMGVIQLVVITSVGWVFSNVTTIREASQLQAYKIEQLTLKVKSTKD
jgi:hypothetical protein